MSLLEVIERTTSARTVNPRGFVTETRRYAGNEIKSKSLVKLIINLVYPRIHKELCLSPLSLCYKIGELRAFPHPEAALRAASTLDHRKIRLSRSLRSYDRPINSAFKALDATQGLAPNGCRVPCARFRIADTIGLRKGAFDFSAVVTFPFTWGRSCQGQVCARSAENTSAFSTCV